MGSYRPPAVMTVHGIRTHAKWQKLLDEVASAQGIPTCPHDYDYLPLLRFLMPCTEGAMIKSFEEWFSTRCQFKDYHMDLNDHTHRPSLIAHSYGTFIVAYALKKHPKLRLDKLILCGSILPRDFDWAELFARDQVNRVINDQGVRDRVTRWAGRVKRRAGDSGTAGFTCDDPRLMNVVFESYGHGDFFNLSHMRDHWVALLTETPSPFAVKCGSDVPSVSDYERHCAATRRLDRVAYSLLPGYDEVPRGQSIEWWRMNPSIYTYLMAGPRRSLVRGYVNAMPMREEAFRRMRRGELRDPDVRPDDVLEFQRGVPVRLYLMSIVVRKGLMGATGGLRCPALHTLINGAIGKLRALWLSHGIRVEEMCAIAWTPQGGRLSEMLGMLPTGSDRDGHVIYTVRVSDLVNSRRGRQVAFQGYRKLLEAYAKS